MPTRKIHVTTPRTRFITQARADRFWLRLAKRARNQWATIAASAVSPSNQ